MRKIVLHERNSQPVYKGEVGTHRKIFYVFVGCGNGPNPFFAFAPEFLEEGH